MIIWKNECDRANKISRKRDPDQGIHQFRYWHKALRMVMYYEVIIIFAGISSWLLYFGRYAWKLMHP